MVGRPRLDLRRVCGDSDGPAEDVAAGEADQHGAPAAVKVVWPDTYSGTPV